LALDAGNGVMHMKRRHSSTEKKAGKSSKPVRIKPKTTLRAEGTHYQSTGSSADLVLHARQEVGSIRRNPGFIHPAGVRGRLTSPIRQARHHLLHCICRFVALSGGFSSAGIRSKADNICSDGRPARAP
jgi:hypothetical protein